MWEGENLSHTHTHTHTHTASNLKQNKIISQLISPPHPHLPPQSQVSMNTGFSTGSFPEVHVGVQLLFDSWGHSQCERSTYASEKQPLSAVLQHMLSRSVGESAHLRLCHFQAADERLHVCTPDCKSVQWNPSIAATIGE